MQEPAPTNPLCAAPALVSGGGSGVGRQIALTLAANGHPVTICGRRSDALRAVADEHPLIHAIAGDVTETDDVQRILEFAIDQHGPPLIAVANAGAALSQSFSRTTAENLNTMLCANVLSTFQLWHSCHSHMRVAGCGRLIAIASTAGVRGYPYVSGYSAAKHAVIGMMRSLSLELATSGITVNAVCPGFMDTPMLDRSIATIVERTGLTADAARARLRDINPQKRFIMPVEVAELVNWLCTSAAAGINGQALQLSGGET